MSDVENWSVKKKKKMLLGTFRVSLDTAEIQTHLCLGFKWWLLCIIYETCKYRIW